MKVDSWFHSSFQNGSSVTYLRKYANCLEDQYRILDFLYNSFNHLCSNGKYTASLKSSKKEERNLTWKTRNENFKSRK